MVLFHLYLGFYVAAKHDDAGREVLKKEKGEERMMRIL
jgi:hypothetical protein